MHDLIVYFIGGFDTLFQFVSPDWREHTDLCVTFALSVAGSFCVVLILLMATIKSCIRAFISLFRGV